MAPNFKKIVPQCLVEVVDRQEKVGRVDGYVGLLPVGVVEEVSVVTQADPVPLANKVGVKVQFSESHKDSHSSLKIGLNTTTCILTTGLEHCDTLRLGWCDGEFVLKQKKSSFGTILFIMCFEEEKCLHLGKFSRSSGTSLTPSAG